LVLDDLEVTQGLKNAPKVTILPFFYIFCIFPSETSQNPTDWVAIGVKQLNSAGKNQNISK